MSLGSAPWYNLFMDLSLVVPSFKQAPTIRRDLRHLTNVLNTLHIDYEIILVIDGNIDGTQQLVSGELDLRHVRIEMLSRNRGKGFALKHGLSQATGIITGFIDAGGDIDYGCLPIMMNLMHFSNADIVIGSKRHPLSIINYPLLRRVYSVAYQLINKALFRLRVRDTQVGVKLFRQEVIQRILPHLQINRFAFDLELLVLARSFGYRQIIESPVRIQHAFRSTINIFSVIQTLHDTILLYFRQGNAAPVPLSSGVAISLLAPRSREHRAERAPELAQ